MSNKDSIESEIQSKGLTAPRVTPADIEANIRSEHFFTGTHGYEGAVAAGEYSGRISGADLEPHPVSHNQLSLLTFCVLVLQNGYTIVGKSACASPENFDAALGRKIAREDAVNQVWPLLGYELRSKLAGGA